MAATLRKSRMAYRVTKSQATGERRTRPSETRRTAKHALARRGATHGVIRQKSAEAVVAAGTGRRAERKQTRTSPGSLRGPIAPEWRKGHDA